MSIILGDNSGAPQSGQGGSTTGGVGSGLSIPYRGELNVNAANGATTSTHMSATAQWQTIVVGMSSKATFETRPLSQSDGTGLSFAQMGNGADKIKAISARITKSIADAPTGNGTNPPCNCSVLLYGLAQDFNLQAAATDVNGVSIKNVQTGRPPLQLYGDVEGSTNAPVTQFDFTFGTLASAQQDDRNYYCVIQFDPPIDTCGANILLAAVKSAPAATNVAAKMEIDAWIVN